MTIYDLYVQKGDTFTQTINLGEDITGYTINASLADRTGYYVNSIATITDAAAGDIKIDLTSVQTSLLANGIGYYDVELTKTADSTVSKPLKGRVYIKGEVTV